MKIFHWNAVSAIVAIVDEVQRLVHVACKVNEIANGFGAFHWISRLVFQYSALFIDCSRHTSVAATVLLQRAFVRSPRNVDVMPGAIVPLVAHVIRPRRSIHHEVRSSIAAPAL